MALQEEFITAFAGKENPAEVFNAGVGAPWFDLDNAKIWKFIIDHWKKHGKIPGLEAIKRQFPTFVPLRTEEPLSYLLEQLKNDYQKRRLNNMASSLAVSINEDNKDVEEVVDEATRAVLDIGRIGSAYKDKDWSERERLKERRQKYLETKAHHGIVGIKTGWRQLDESLLGLQPSHLTTLVARPKTGKTWWTCIVAQRAFLQGKNVLYISCEMGAMQIEQRLDALQMGVSYDRLRKGQLTVEEEAKYEEYANTFEAGPVGNRLIVSSSDDMGGRSGTDMVQSKLSVWTPDLLVVDGVYKLRDAHEKASMVENNYAVSQNMARITKKYNVSTVQTVQVTRPRNEREKRMGGGIDRIAWGDTWGQESDQVIELVSNSIYLADRRLKHDLIAHRGGAVMDFQTKWDFERMDFTEILDKRFFDTSADTGDDDSGFIDDITKN
jgi:replicative DNA helicase